MLSNSHHHDSQTVTPIRTSAHSDEKYGSFRNQHKFMELTQSGYKCRSPQLSFAKKDFVCTFLSHRRATYNRWLSIISRSFKAPSIEDGFQHHEHVIWANSKPMVLNLKSPKLFSFPTPTYEMWWPYWKWTHCKVWEQKVQPLLLRRQILI